MKRSFLILICLSAATFCLQAQAKKQPVKPEPQKQETAKPQAQPQAQGTVNPMTEHFYKKYVTAIQWNDFDVAKDALYDLIIENPQNDSLIFNLAYFYYENQKYPSSILVCQQLLAKNPKNTGALEVAAIGYEMMRIPDRALQSYESLYLITNDINALYKMAFLQYELKRLNEALATIETLLAKKEVETSKLVFSDAQNKQKEYAMKVAILNLKGMVVLDHLGDKAAAKKLYEESLALAADFQPAKDNLAKLK